MQDDNNRQNAASDAGQQRGSQSQSDQQQQFQTGQGQQSGDSGADSRFADQIRPHQVVVDQSGARVGTVDHVDGDRIKLTRDSSGDDAHHYVPLSLVAGIEGDQIRLRDRGDASFGQEAVS